MRAPLIMQPFKSVRRMLRVQAAGVTLLLLLMACTKYSWFKLTLPILLTPVLYSTPTSIQS